MASDGAAKEILGSDYYSGWRSQRFKCLDPAEIEKMSNAEKKEYLSRYLEWYTENAKASTAKGMSFSLNGMAPAGAK